MSNQTKPDHTFPFNFLKIHFDIILLSVPMPSKWFLSLKFPSLNCMHFSTFLRSTWVAHLILLQYLVKSTIYEALHCACFSSLLSLPSSLVQIFHSVVSQSRFRVRIPNRQTFEIDRKLDILVTALVYMMIEGGVIKAFIVAPCFIKR
jgi:hypothetical protein